jgi:hypothetical protein
MHFVEHKLFGRAQSDQKREMGGEKNYDGKKAASRDGKSLGLVVQHIHRTDRITLESWQTRMWTSGIFLSIALNVFRISRHQAGGGSDRACDKFTTSHARAIR